MFLTFNNHSNFSCSVISSLIFWTLLVFFNHFVEFPWAFSACFTFNETISPSDETSSWPMLNSNCTRSWGPMIPYRSLFFRVFLMKCFVCFISLVFNLESFYNNMIFTTKSLIALWKRTQKCSRCGEKKKKNYKIQQLHSYSRCLNLTISIH